MYTHCDIYLLKYVLTLITCVLTVMCTYCNICEWFYLPSWMGNLWTTLLSNVSLYVMGLLGLVSAALFICETSFNSLVRISNIKGVVLHKC